MIFGKTKLELKVGVFVFVGLVILTIFVLYIGDFKTWGSGFRIKINFGFTNGIKVGAPVRFAGVDVGEVKRIDLTFSPQEQKTNVEITCLLKKEARVPSDSQAWVNTLGLLGEKYVEIIPGKNYNDCLKTDQFITGNDPIPMNEIFGFFRSIAADLDDAIAKIKDGQGTVGKLLNDDSIYTELEAFVSDVRRNPWKLFWKTKEQPPKK
jgi:phospholipid/cholesterol/gamma-HCH transport system substrate-binding protein